MRLSVILGDFAVYIPACVTFVCIVMKSYSRSSQLHVIPFSAHYG